MSETEKHPPEETIAQLFTEHCMEPGHGVGGHGTPDRVTAEKILAEGIQVNPNYMLGNIAAALPLDSTEAAKEICHWQHKSSKFIVILSIPDTLRERQLIERIWDEQKNNHRAKIAPRFIKGYFDVEQQTFVQNPLYESAPAPVEVIDHIAARELEDRKEMKRLMADPQPDPPIPMPSGDNNIPADEIW
jgi:hypothetical protein